MGRQPQSADGRDGPGLTRTALRTPVVILSHAEDPAWAVWPSRHRAAWQYPGIHTLSESWVYLGQHSLEQFHRQAHDVGDGAVDAFDEFVAVFLDGVGAGLVDP